MNLQDTLAAFLVKAKHAECERLCVAFSGGIDSHVLLDQLNILNQGLDSIPLDAIYINHNLQAESLNWGEHCKKICKAKSIPFQIIDVDASADPGESPEAKARTVRYRALSEQIKPKQWLLTAQHMEDQAETLLLQLLRGSGVNGLSAMPTHRLLGGGEHYRPLLKTNKWQIEQYAEDNHLQWIEDPSNQDQTIPRNYLRKTVIPMFENVWPETTKMIDRSSSWLAEAADILKEVAEQDLKVCRSDFRALSILKLQTLSKTRQKNLLRYWFYSLGLKRPGNDKLELIFEQIINARDDANPQLDWQGKSVKRYKKHLYIITEFSNLDPNWQASWDAVSSYNFTDGNILVSEISGQGLNRIFQKKNLTIKLRQGGESCHPVERTHSRSLKKLFQEYSVPPWLRDRWPLVYLEEQLIAVPGLFICKGFEAQASEVGLQFTVNFK